MTQLSDDTTAPPAATAPPMATEGVRIAAMRRRHLRGVMAI